MVHLPSPRNSSGFIDLAKVYYFVTKHFNVSLVEYDDVIEDIDPVRLSWLFQEHQEEEKQFFEVMAHTISVGYGRTQTKKKINLFDESKTKVTKITEEQRTSKLSSLKKSFGK